MILMSAVQDVYWFVGTRTQKMNAQLILENYM